MRTTALAITAFLLVFTSCRQAQKEETNTKNSEKMNSTEDKYTFQLSDNVSRQKVTFKNRYGITLTGDLYTPRNMDSRKAGFGYAMKQKR
ncbi:hypothetical protein [Pedobacter chinensis]|uniref:hypothetical protein n=1 Tax=Pedobacter chinensis TaxID=2282421 RepID=UPI0018F6EDC8|nr:hypothetical protein [Pedobacter chinensis]